MNRILVERARCLLFDAGLDKSFLLEAVGTACYIVNRSPTKGLQVTPEERFSGEKPDLSNLHVFGTVVMTHIPKVGRKKWDPKSREGIFVGYAAGFKGYRVYNPRSRKVYVSRDVVFLNEDCNEELRDFKPETLQLQFGWLQWTSIRNPSMIMKMDQRWNHQRVQSTAKSCRYQQKLLHNNRTPIVR